MDRSFGDMREIRDMVRVARVDPDKLKAQRADAARAMARRLRLRRRYGEPAPDRFVRGALPTSHVMTPKVLDVDFDGG